MTRAKKGIAATLEKVGELAERERNKDVKYVRVGRPAKPEAQRGQVYSIRIPGGEIEHLKRVAEANGKQPAVQARDWILERLQESSVEYATKSSRGRAPVKRAAKKTAGHTSKKAARRR